MLFGLRASVAVGLTNGLITTYLGVPSFITTLGMPYFLNGINLRSGHGFQVATPGGHTFTKIFGGYPLWFNSEFWWGLLAVVLLRDRPRAGLRWGVHTVATGGNAIGARESGVNVRWIKIGNFMLCSVLGGFAGNPGLDPDHIDSAAAGRHRHHVPRRRWLRSSAGRR